VTLPGHLIFPESEFSTIYARFCTSPLLPLSLL
jgi:hypothetical protein